MDYIYIIVIVAGLSGAAILYFKYWGKNEKKIKSNPQSKEDRTPQNEVEIPSEEARIYDNIRGTIYNATIPGDEIEKIRNEHGTLGRKWLRDGRWLYAFNRRHNDLKEPCYAPVIVPITLDNPPSRLRRALTHPYVAITWNAKRPKSLLAKYGSIFLFAGVVAFLLFMLVAQ